MNAPPRTIGVAAPLLLGLLDELSRTRSLRDEETALLEIVIERTDQRRVYRKWTPQLDRALLRVAHKRSGIRAFAERHSMTPLAAYSRLNKLKAKKAKSPPPDNRRKD